MEVVDKIYGVIFILVYFSYIIYITQFNNSKKDPNARSMASDVISPLMLYFLFWYLCAKLS